MAICALKLFVRADSSLWAKLGSTHSALIEINVLVIQISSVQRFSDIAAL